MLSLQFFSILEHRLLKGRNTGDIDRHRTLPACPSHGGIQVFFLIFCTSENF